MPEGFCLECHGKCCKEFTVYLTHLDIRRLSSGLGLAPSSFIRLYEVVPRHKHPIINLSTCEVRIGLRREDGGCCFLVNREGALRCSVHDHKPMECRIYPYGLDVHGGLNHLANYMCPFDVRPRNEAESRDIVRGIRRQKEELRKYSEIVEGFNNLPEKRRQDIDDFLRYSSRPWGFRWTMRRRLDQPPGKPHDRMDLP